jgi:hypothetical protein
MAEVIFYPNGDYFLSIWIVFNLILFSDFQKEKKKRERE